MSTFGDEFVNVREVLDARRGPGPAGSPRELPASLLRDLALDLMGSGALRTVGGTLYFEPGVYVLRPDARMATEPMVIPRMVAVRFAPGALLVVDGAIPTSMDSTPGAPVPGLIPGVLDNLRDLLPAPRPRLRIEGPLLASPGPVFGTLATERQRRANPVLREDAVGVIEVGESTDTLFPEWWGADSEADTEVNADAVQACFDAAVGAALLRDPAREPTTVECVGSYLLAWPVALRSRWTMAPPTVTLRVRGRPGRALGDLPKTFRGASGTFGQALLDVAPSIALILEDVGFDGAGIAAHVVSVRGGPDGARASFRMAQCGLGNTTGALLALTADPTLDARLGPGPRPSLVVEGCAFEGMNEEVSSLVHGALPGAGVSLRGCTFNGVAAGLVRCLQGRTELRGCAFQNRGVVALEDGVEAPCADVLLATTAAEPPPSLLGLACQSRSPQLLRGVGGLSLEGMDVQLVASVHGNTSRAEAATPDPPSVAWLTTSRQTLVLRACSFLPSEGPPSPARGPRGGQVLVGPGELRVFSVANRYAAPEGVVDPPGSTSLRVRTLGDTTHRERRPP
ncbi:MAG: hypothetical protein HY909_18840 [Deltaproteobacteria bacterium]|nr:hypothetical protein [Deltaproteobacteria bacterium]